MGVNIRVTTGDNGITLRETAILAGLITEEEKYDPDVQKEGYDELAKNDHNYSKIQTY